MYNMLTGLLGRAVILDFGVEWKYHNMEATSQHGHIYCLGHKAITQANKKRFFFLFFCLFFCFFFFFFFCFFVFFFHISVLPIKI